LFPVSCFLSKSFANFWFQVLFFFFARRQSCSPVSVLCSAVSFLV
jgi:hypothetical protein